VIDITSTADMIIIVKMHEAFLGYHRRHPGWTVDVRATANNAKSRPRASYASTPRARGLELGGRPGRPAGANPGPAASHVVPK
jgi:hypothetical protein